MDPTDTAQAWPFSQEKHETLYEGEQGGPGGVHKGVAALVDELSHRDDVCLFALDMTEIRLESSSYYGWAPKGLPVYAEAKGGSQGS